MGMVSGAYKDESEGNGKRLKTLRSPS